jgi:predicted amidophosphoribosyltransferase
MSGSQEVFEQKKKENVSPPSSKSEEKSNEQTGKICTNCKASVPEEALFCPECGFNLNQPNVCPHCGAATTSGADICLVCKSWLLEGQCKFCYSPMPSEAAFCPECGNPKDGIPCPQCGKLSIFDFCTSCGIPLSDGAKAALELAATDPGAKKMIEAVQEVVSIEAELAKLNELINTIPEVPPAPPQVKKERFSAVQMASLLKTDVNMDAAAVRRADEERKAAEAAVKKAEEERRAKIREAETRKEELEKQKRDAFAAAQEEAQKIKFKTFITHQSARAFHNARRPKNTVGWLCNFTNTIHPEGPNGCDEPGHGGYWYDGEVVYVERVGPS